jgi:hypothetical protein
MLGLVLLDLSAAFDSVDYDILLTVLDRRFGVKDTAMNWFPSCLGNRTQIFVYNGWQSIIYPIDCSAPGLSFRPGRHHSLHCRHHQRHRETLSAIALVRRRYATLRQLPTVEHRRRQAAGLTMRR